MKDLAAETLFDRRTRFADRRGWQAMPSTPFVDSEGNLVSMDRRRLPDRRLSSIRVEVMSPEAAVPAIRACR